MIKSTFFVLILLNSSLIFSSQQRKQCPNLKGMLVAAVVGVVSLFDPAAGMCQNLAAQIKNQNINGLPCFYGEPVDRDFTNRKIGNVIIDAHNWYCVGSDGQVKWGRKYPGELTE